MLYHVPLVQILISKNLGCKIVNIFLSISLNTCFGCFHLYGSFEYPGHMFWFRVIKLIFNYALLSRAWPQFYKTFFILNSSMKFQFLITSDPVLAREVIASQLLSKTKFQVQHEISTSTNTSWVLKRTV